MRVGDWEVVGPTGEYYGRYKTKPTKLPIYAIAREVNDPSMIHLGQEQEPTTKRLTTDEFRLVLGGVAAIALLWWATDLFKAKPADRWLMVAGATGVTIGTVFGRDIRRWLGLS